MKALRPSAQGSIFLEGAHFMRQDDFTFKPQFKSTIIGNHKPVLKNVDDARGAVSIAGLPSPIATMRRSSPPNGQAREKPSSGKAFSAELAKRGFDRFSKGTPIRRPLLEFA